MDEVFDFVISYIDHPADRRSVSLVCRRWHHLDAITRKQVTVAFCYSTNPQRLSSRFPHLEALRVKGKPRASMFNLIPDNWGGFATPWVNEIALNLKRLKSVHFRRMIVTDSDLVALATACGPILQELKLDMCSDFSTSGLLQVARCCRLPLYFRLLSLVYVCLFSTSEFRVLIVSLSWLPLPVVLPFLVKLVVIEM